MKNVNHKGHVRFVKRLKTILKNKKISQHLSRNQRLVANYIVFKNASLTDAAMFFGVNRNTINSHKYRICKKLEQFVDYGVLTQKSNRNGYASKLKC